MKFGIRLALFLAISTVFAPSVTAQIENEVDVRTHLLSTFTENLDSAPAGNLVTRNITWDPPYSYEPELHTITLKVRYTMTVQLASDGVWNLTIANEFGFVDDCEFDVETQDPGGFLSGDLVVYPHYSMECLFRVSEKSTVHNHTVYFNRTVLTGTPSAPSFETVSFIFSAEDVVIVDPATPFELETGTTGLEFLTMMAVVAAAIVIWSRSADPAIQLLSSGVLMLLGVIQLSLISSWPVWTIVSVVLMLSSAYMTARTFIDAAKRRTI